MDGQSPCPACPPEGSCDAAADALHPGTLEASSCGCGRLYFPPRGRCASCGEATKLARVAAQGQVATYTIVYVVPDGMPSPMRLALVRLQGGAHALCESRSADLAVGKKVKLAAQGQRIFCYE